MLEWYRTGANYRDLMTDCENLLAFLQERFLAAFPDLCDFVTGSIFCDGYKVRLTEGGENIILEEAFQHYAPLSLESAIAADRFEELLVQYIEPHLGRNRPTFLYDYPVVQASLARTKVGEPGIAERFELYLCGIELANGFSELTDGREQRRRFLEEARCMKQAGRGIPDLPERFLSAIDNLTACAGIAFGLDRLFMLILGKESIDKAVSFPPADL